MKRRPAGVLAERRDVVVADRNIDTDAALDEAGLKNTRVREFVRYWANLAGAERIEVVSAADDARLIRESLDAGEILPAGPGRYYARSYIKDTARSEERTIVATNNPADKGVYKNWRPASEMRPLLEKQMRGASEGKTVPRLVVGRSLPSSLLSSRLAVRPASLDSSAR